MDDLLWNLLKIAAALLAAFLGFRFLQGFVEGVRPDLADAVRRLRPLLGSEPLDEDRCRSLSAACWSVARTTWFGSAGLLVLGFVDRRGWMPSVFVVTAVALASAATLLVMACAVRVRRDRMRRL
jgi:hypothetical protein